MNIFRSKFSAAAIAAQLLCCPALVSAQIPGLGSLPGLPKMEDVQKTLLSDTIFKGGSCVLTGGASALVGKKLAAKASKNQSLTAKEKKQREQSYMLGLGMAGCAMGSSVAARIIQNRTEGERKAQDEAWHQAQIGTGPVNWSSPDNSDVHGEVELTDIHTSDGKECGTRRDLITTRDGTANPYTDVCRSAGSDEPFEIANSTK